MTYDWAKPGVKVVCITPVNSTFTPVILEGDIHTISRVEMGYKVDSAGAIRRDRPQDVAIWLQGIDTGNYAYMAKFFKPLVEKKLPASLTSILTNPKKAIRQDQFDKNKKWEPV